MLVHEGGFGHVAAALNKVSCNYILEVGLIRKVIGYDFHENIYIDIILLDLLVDQYDLFECDHCIGLYEVKLPLDYLIFSINKLLMK